MEQKHCLDKCEIIGFIKNANKLNGEYEKLCSDIIGQDRSAEELIDYLAGKNLDIASLRAELIAVA